MSNVAMNNGETGFSVIGTTPLRPDGLDKVTGKARFADDFHLPGMLHGKILRSPHAHARIKSIDTRAAEAPARRTRCRDRRGFPSGRT